MNRFLRLIAVAGMVCVAALAQAGPAFEAVSIKPVPAPTPVTMPAWRPVYNLDAARVEIRNYPLLLVLTRAFGVQIEQIAAPDFIRNEYFDVQATLPAGSTKEQVPAMLQTMLAERFQLTYYRESREYPETVLTVGKGGMKLPRLPDDAKRSNSQLALADGTMQITMTGRVKDLFPVMGSFGQFPQPVDETGLDGNYTWVRYQAPASADMTFGDASHESFRNMIEAAGLKLETRRVPKETIVVDHIEKTPTEN
ncbi:MAG TPA: TIGR03435 family protein [Bryobacteraceae bacterium]|nr:TIGR03435 family protein [Bryobacteraceae bacterium]